MFPPGIRGKAVGLAISTNWLTNFIVALITPWMLKSITFGTFYFFLAFCVILFVWVWFAVPETRGVPIEEMDRLFGGNAGDEVLRRIANIQQTLGLEENRQSTRATVEKAEVKEGAVCVESSSTTS